MAAKSPKKAAVSPLKEQRKVGRPSKATTAKPTIGNTENISPKSKTIRKRDVANVSSDESASPSKRIRISSKATSARSTQQSTSNTKKSTPDDSVIEINHKNHKKTQSDKPQNINVELDISFDANVVITVKRKNKKKEQKSTVNSPNRSIQSTDEIPASDKSFEVQTRVYKRAPRPSPRSK